LASSPFVAIVPETHPLASRPTVRLSELVTERWIDSPAGYAARIVFDRVLADAGLTRVISAEVGDAGEIPKLVAAGLGIAVIPELIYRAGPPVVTRSIAGVDTRLNLSVISRPHPTPAAAAFLELISTELLGADPVGTESVGNQRA
jgi:DNA-binding transcriptional LysR family regulator